MNNKTHKDSLFETIIVILVTILLIGILIGNYIQGTMTAKIAIFVIFGVILWYILGCVVLALIDTNQELYEWVWNKAPNDYYSMLAIFLFPIVAIVYIRGKKIL